MDGVIAVCVGLGLSAASGFRVFIPMLGISIASLTGHLELGAGFEWIGSPLALIAFGTATVIEIGAYYIPWLDNLLDTISTPSAIVVGTVITASMFGDVSPLVKWSVAVMGGGGSAGIIQTGTVLLRGTSSASTGGLGNFVVSTLEWISAMLITVLAIVVPIIALVFVIMICFSLIKRFGRLFFKRRAY